MPEYRPEIFISSTSHDLRSYRQVITDELFKAGYHPIVQEYFGADHRSLTRKLNESICNCSTVICLVGHVFGAAPDLDCEAPRSYTQLEYDAARLLGIRVYLLFTQDESVADNPPDQSDALRALQESYRESILPEGTASFFDSHSRLRDQILRIIPQLPGAHLLPKWAHVPTKPSFFAGRQFELDQLSRTQEESSNCLIAVIGLGGQGKSTLVYEWVNRMVADTPDHYRAQYWCTAMQSGMTFDSFLDDVLGYLLGDGYDKRAEPEMSIRVKKLLGIMSERRILLVVDGMERWLAGWAGADDMLASADTVDQRTGTDEELDDFLAQATGITSGTRLILTSRALPAVLDNAGCSVVPVYEDGQVGTLQGLDDEAVVDLFGRLGVRGSPAALTALAEPHANHPLAVTVLAGLIKKKYGGDLSKTKKVSALDRRRALFQLFDEARENLPGGAISERLLQLASHCLENASLEVLVALFENAGEDNQTPLSVPDEFDDAEEFIRELAITLGDWHLVDWIGEDQVVALHPLVKEFYVSRTADSQQLHKALHEWYSDRPIPEFPENLADAKPRDLAIQHALRARLPQAAKDLIYRPLTPTSSFVDWLRRFGHLTKGIQLLTAIANDADPIDAAELTVTKAAFQRPLGKFDETIEGLTQAISTLESAAENRDTDVMSNLVGALINRGNVYRESVQSARAESDFGQAFELCKTTWADTQTREHLATSVLTNRGNLYNDLGHISRARRDYDLAIQTYQGLFDPAYLTVDATYAQYLSNRACLLVVLRDFDAALVDARSAIEIYETLVEVGLNELRPSLARGQVTLAMTLREYGEFDESRAIYDEAIRVYGEFIEQGRLDLGLSTATAYVGRSKLLRQCEDYDAALLDNDRAKSIYKRSIQSGRPELRAFENQCILAGAIISFRNGDHDSAEQWWREGVSRTQDLVQEGETDQLIMLTEYWGKWVLAEFDSKSTTATDSLSAFVQHLESILSADDMPEQMWIEANEAIENLQPHAEILLANEFDVKRFDDLHRRVTSRRLKL